MMPNRKNPVQKSVEAVDWTLAIDKLHRRGHVTVSGFINRQECEDIKQMYNRSFGFRKEVSMERYRFGVGHYKYFDYPLPETIQNIRATVYPRLVEAANFWMKALKIGQHYPAKHSDFIQQCRLQGQSKPTALILRYEAKGHNTLHQDIYGPVYFPFQLVLFLDEPGVDYTGGAFVMTQQIPRAQSKPIVLQPKKGDMLLFTTNFRPIKGNKGYYWANIKHGVSEVISGKRHTLGIIFHDATN